MSADPGDETPRPATFFADAAAFRRWLEAHHDTATELWMGLNKRHVTPRGLTWEEAVAEALCFGWIDSQVQSLGPDSVRQRWTPRKPGGNWSTVNVAHVERLTAAGRMHPAGLAAYARRRPDRSGIYSYEQTGLDDFPEPYAAVLAADALAGAWWAAATPSYRRICVNWVLTAKQQATRDRRMAQVVDDSRHGRLIPSQRYGEPPAWVARSRSALGLPRDDAG